MVKSAPKLAKIDFFKPIVISKLADAQGIWDMVFLQRNLQKRLGHYLYHPSGGFQITVGLKKRLRMVEFNKRHTQDHNYRSKRTCSDPGKHLLDVLETIST